MELKRLLTRANALLLQGAYQGAESFIEQAMVEADKIKKELAELDTMRTRVTEMAAEVERLTTENANLQPVIDEANAQEPFRWFLADRVNQSEDMLTEVTGNIDPAREVLMPMYLRPIPAQQFPDKTEYVPISDDMQSVFIDGFGLLPIQYPDSQQSPAVAGRDDWDSQAYQSMCDNLEHWKSRALEAENLLEKIRNDISPMHMGEPVITAAETVDQALIAASYARDAIRYKSELDELRSAPRITEQDAMDVIKSFCDWYDKKQFFVIIEGPRDAHVLKCYMEDEGRALLNKLNGDKNGK